MKLIPKTTAGYQSRYKLMLVVQYMMFQSIFLQISAKHKSSKLLNISGKKYLMNASRKTLKRVHPEINQASTSNNTGIPSKQRLSLSKAAGTSPGSLVRSSPGRKAIARYVVIF